MNAELQYLDLCDRVLSEGVWVDNKRTGKRCLTIINADMEYDVGNKDFPILTTKKVAWKSALAEMLGYLRGYTNATEFSKIGCNTWFANANLTKAWLSNPARKGENDMGKVYGAVAKDYGGINLIEKVYNNLRSGVDDRGEIITFWKPDDFDKGCLRPCMFQHHFTLLDGVLNLHSYQRSSDLALGVPFNMTQTYFLLELMAKITNNKAGKVFHKMVNVHLYEDQVDIMKMQVKRTPINNKAKFFLPTYHDVHFNYDLDWVTKTFDIEQCSLLFYEHQGVINYPFSE